MAMALMFQELNAASFNSGNANSGDVLTADGNGGASWETPSGGGGGNNMVGGWNVARYTFDVSVDGGAIGVYPLFSVSGVVLVQAMMRVEIPALAEGGYIGLGIVGDEGGLLPLSFWDEGPAQVGKIQSRSYWFTKTPLATQMFWDQTAWSLVADDTIVFSITDAPLSAGKFEIFCFWGPLSENASLTAE